ncbi:hypothetical protein HDU76_010170 [Blyttiomyces sp. JEL0837]|nr:hypothetical protein HDU76_010170 [Blyttiomyces sp. JEL0837]
MHLNQLTIQTTNIESSTEFYKSLGLTLIVSTDTYRRFEVDSSDSSTTTLSLSHADDATGAANGPHLYFELDSRDQLVAKVDELKKKGVVFDVGGHDGDAHQTGGAGSGDDTVVVVDQRWLWTEAWLTDPTTGVKICFYFAGVNRRYPPWRIN